MSATGAVLMVKKKPTKANDNPDERVAVIVLKGTTDYRDWLAEMSKDSLIPIASIVRDALAKWAKQRGYPDPPTI